MPTEYTPRPGHVVVNPWKALGAVAATVSAVFGVGTTIHSKIVVPGILAEARREAAEMLDDRLERHESRTHTGAISRNEMDLVLEQLRSINTRMERMEGYLLNPPRQEDSKR